MESMIYVNASEHENGGTSRIGKQFLDGYNYRQIDLVNYKIYQIGQHYDDDEFITVFNQLIEADGLVLGTPVYWHTISAYLKTLMERISQMDPAEVGRLKGKRVFLLVQGADPSDTIGPATQLIKRFCQVLGLTFVGSASTSQAMNELRKQL